MKTQNCPYTKISQETETENKNILALADQALSSKAYAQGSTNLAANFSTTLGDNLTIPFFLIIGSFFLFVILMSAVYIYHWMKFNLEDPFIKSFVPIFFAGLVFLTIPLIFNLFF